jgi:hypothetical protein
VVLLLVVSEHWLLNAPYLIPWKLFICPQAFVIFCGLGISNCQLYEEVSLSAARQAVALEVIIVITFILRTQNSQLPTIPDFSRYI